MKIWLQAKVNDTCSLQIKEGKIVIYEHEGYVFDLIPGHGDYLELLIDADTGRIINWQVCSEIVRKFIQEQKQNK